MAKLINSLFKKKCIYGKIRKKNYKIKIKYKTNNLKKMLKKI